MFTVAQFLFEFISPAAVVPSYEFSQNAFYQYAFPPSFLLFFHPSTINHIYIDDCPSFLSIPTISYSASHGDGFLALDIILVIGAAIQTKSEIDEVIYLLYRTFPIYFDISIVQQLIYYYDPLGQVQQMEISAKRMELLGSYQSVGKPIFKFNLPFSSPLLSCLLPY